MKKNDKEEEKEEEKEENEKEENKEKEQNEEINKNKEKENKEKDNNNNNKIIIIIIIIIITEKIEGQIYSLTDQLASARSVNDKFKIFNELNTKSPKSIRECQTQILESIEIELREKLLNEYENDSTSQMNKMKGILNVSGKTFWYQFNRKVNVYKKRIEDIFGENGESSNKGKKIIIDLLF